MRPLTRQASVLVLSVATSHCRSEAPPCPACPSATPPAALAPSAATATATASAAASSAAPEADENPWCERGDASYGTWTATPEQALAAARKLGGACAPPAWFTQAAGDCMQRLGQSNVKVMAGVMVGDRATDRSCVLSVSSAEWEGRRFIAIRSDVRDQATFFNFASAFEIKPRGLVRVTDDCQGAPTAPTGPAGARHQPDGWAKFPEGLRDRLCTR